MRPETQTSTAVSSQRITFAFRNVSSREFTIKCSMPIAYLFPVDVFCSSSCWDKGNLPEKLTPISFDFGDSTVYLKNGRGYI